MTCGQLEGAGHFYCHYEALGRVGSPTLVHPSEQRSLAGDPDSDKNKYVARVGHPELYLLCEKR
jgi:hypothetical protein